MAATMTETVVRVLYPRLEDFVKKRRREMGEPTAWIVVTSVKEANQFAREHLPQHLWPKRWASAWPQWGFAYPSLRWPVITVHAAHRDGQPVLLVEFWQNRLEELERGWMAKISARGDRELERVKFKG